MTLNKKNLKTNSTILLQGLFSFKKCTHSNINLISNFEQNLIEDFYQQNKCFNSNTCYVCKRIEETKDDFTKKRIKRLIRVKNIIKHKGCQKSARIKKMLKNARFL